MKSGIQETKVGNRMEEGERKVKSMGNVTDMVGSHLNTEGVKSLPSKFLIYITSTVNEFKLQESEKSSLLKRLLKYSPKTFYFKRLLLNM